LQNRGLLVRQAKDSLAVAAVFPRAGLRPDYVPALTRAGLILANRTKNRRSRAYFTNALRQNPGYVETYLNLDSWNKATADWRRPGSLPPEAANLQSETARRPISARPSLLRGASAPEAIDLFRAGRLHESIVLGRRASLFGSS